METSLLKQTATIFFRAQNSIMNLTESLGSFQKFLIFLCWQEDWIHKFCSRNVLQKSLYPFPFSVFFFSFFFSPPCFEAKHWHSWFQWPFGLNCYEIDFAWQYIFLLAVEISMQAQQPQLFQQTSHYSVTNSYNLIWRKSPAKEWYELPNKCCIFVAFFILERMQELILGCPKPGRSRTIIFP